ncbi:Phosphatidylinositol 4,5-bisphosphate 3-kinase catalytic subunit beta isoform [Holothuria leucospilota]|uniref:phosphatidylinositol 3-kinase n=1 Tax=Holothuria leucospilota TaxID=206669 RepID=A0A9Q1BCU1_HOLLE|nr:Phosphatidylinositol 4,5-bisphosphate 3-kinase catalytic subunit beta isoform [Holothuria leucospilota]
MPPGSWTQPDFWHQKELVQTVELLCLLPNGIIVPLRCDRESTLSTIKRELWEVASKFPVYNQLLDLNFYNFLCVLEGGEREELLEERKRISDIKPFCNTLTVVRKAGDAEEKVLNSRIGLLIGKSLHEFDNMTSPEVIDFRQKTRNICMTIQKERLKWNWENRAVYLFPPQLESSADMHAHVREAFKDDRFSVSVGLVNGGPSTKKVLQVGAYDTPDILISLALKAFSQIQKNPPGDYVLKVPSQEDFLLRNYPLCQYKYIRRTVCKFMEPELILMLKKDVKVEERFIDPMVNVLTQGIGAPPLPSRRGKEISWDIDEEVRLKLIKAHNVNVLAKTSLVRVKLEVFHGGDALCGVIESQDVEGSSPEWHESHTIGLKVKDLPRMAKLCITLYCNNAKKLTKRRDNRRDLVPIAWVNTTFFDYKHQLRTGVLRLAMWPASEDVDFYSFGTVESNPNQEDATVLEIMLHEGIKKTTITYPPFDLVLERAAEIAAEKNDHTFKIDYISDARLDELRHIVNRDPLETLSDQEREDLWNAREDCLQSIPHSLPRLLTCTRWHKRDDVAQMQAMLQVWRKLPPEEAMELLDYKYPDPAVRKFAVDCLKELTDDLLSQYLLQLVQALKHESYLDCDLGLFLLRRALANQRIGHFLFWHMRAEMHQPAVSTRFGLMLEAYCRGSIAHIKTLSKQVESLHKMKSVNELIKNSENKSNQKDELLQMMHKVLCQDSYKDALSYFVSPLSPSFKLKCLKLEKCRYFSSKMRPLWLVFQNEDPVGDDIKIIFKNGDDLRQDMLTLQVMQIMDNIWQEEGLDLRVIPYGTLATGDKVGLIEVVSEADTIAKIQKQYRRGKIKAAFQKKAIFEWLKKHNTEPKLLDRAVEDFRRSCAGYCVATYILGIGDRHNDNIMVKKTGQLFHIDFGHFLGNTKRKFGVNRERVPFVLTNDFVHVITRGENEESTPEFAWFKESCELAFIILRRRGNLLINLFAMMLSAGIPELSDDTIVYLRDTLNLDVEEDEALAHFRSKFTDALKNSWTTSVNWMVHHIANKGD